MTQLTRAYTLPSEEVERAMAAGGPLQDLGLDPDKLRDMQIAVVEVEGQIVAYWVAWKALHLEPLWIHPDHRKTLRVVGGIIQAAREVVEQSGEPAAYCQIDAENLAVVGAYAQRLGFLEAPGKLFYLVPHPATEGAQ